MKKGNVTATKNPVPATKNAMPTMTKTSSINSKQPKPKCAKAPTTPVAVKKTAPKKVPIVKKASAPAVDPLFAKRSEAAKKAWITIRANKALATASQKTKKNK